jgi:hypothetical protein
MAVVTQVVASFNNDAVVCEVLITTADNLTGNATGLHAVNTTDQQCYGELYLADGTHKVSSTIMPHTDTTVPIPTTQAARLPMTWDTRRNRWVGIRGTFLGPTNPLAIDRFGVAPPEPLMEIQHYPPDDE